MNFVICFLMTLGIKLSYYFAAVIMTGDNGNGRKYGIIAAIASYLIEIIQLIMGTDFFMFTRLLVAQLAAVLVITVAYMWVRKRNRNIINVTIIIVPFVMIALMNYSRPEGNDVFLMVISWLLGGAFCSCFMRLVMDIPDRKSQGIEIRKIKDEMSLKENQFEIMQIYEDVSQKCIENIETIKQEIIKNADERELNDKIEQSVSALRIREYCSNAIVNQIIYQMEKRCRDIDFKADADINTIIKVDDLSLSSVMLNLLDNAYNYCIEDNKSKTKFIRLRMNMNGDYLTISVTNSYSGRIKAKKKKVNPVVKEHGWGKVIINDIAKKYNGDFNTVINKKDYTATVILCCGQEEL